MMQQNYSIIGIFVVGNFNEYKVVRYRAYRPTDLKSYSKRISDIVASNVTILAAVTAMYRMLRSSGVNVGSIALIGVLPVTLVRSINEVCQIESPGEFEHVKAEQLVEGIKQAAMVRVGKCISGCNDGRIYIPRIDAGNDAGELLYPRNGSGHTLPRVFRMDIRFEAADACGDEKLAAPGRLYLIAVPVPGAYKVDETLCRFYEKHSADAFELHRLLVDSVVLGMRIVVNDFADFIRGEVHRAVIAVDSSHGLNILTTSVVDAVARSLNLIRYEFERRGISLEEFGDGYALLYNSAAAARLREDCEEELSYYYTSLRAVPLTELAGEAVELVNRGDVALGPLLVKSGLILLGVHVLKRVTGIVDNEPRVEVLVDRQGCKIEYKFSGWVDQTVAWLVDLLRKASDEIYQESRRYVDVVEQCWKGILRSCDITCISVDLLKRLVSEQAGGLGWHYRLIREVVDPAMRLVVSHELKEYADDLAGRVIYFAVPALRRRPDDDICRGLHAADGGYACITPMVEQTSTRNVLAHGGLTPVDRSFTLVVSSPGQAKCSVEAFCLASSIEFVRRLVDEIYRGREAS